PLVRIRQDLTLRIQLRDLIRQPTVHDRLDLPDRTLRLLRRQNTITSHEALLQARQHTPASADKITKPKRVMMRPTQQLGRPWNNLTIRGSVSRHLGPRCGGGHAERPGDHPRW